MYNSPVLFKESPSIVDEFSPKLNKRKFVVISDSSASHEAERFIGKINADVPYEFSKVTEADYKREVRTLLSQQKVGTQLYIAGEWDNSYIIFAEAIKAGFLEEEIQTYIYGQKKKFIYCMKCYETTEIHNEKEAQCSHCRSMLSVGPFFSKVHKGYIGYPFIPN